MTAALAVAVGGLQIVGASAHDLEAEGFGLLVTAGVSSSILSTARIRPGLHAGKLGNFCSILILLELPSPFLVCHITILWKASAGLMPQIKLTYHDKHVRKRQH